MIEKIAIEFRHIKHILARGEPSQETPVDVWNWTTDVYKEDAILEVKDFLLAIKNAGFEILNVSGEKK